MENNMEKETQNIMDIGDENESKCVVEDEYSVFYVSDVRKATDIIKKHQQEANVRFAAYYVTENFGNTDFSKKKHKLLWNAKNLPFTGVPFFIVGRKILDCEYGVNRRLKNVDDPKKRPKKTKKSQCPARISISEIVEFPDLKIDNDTSWKRVDGSKRLRRLLSASVSVKFARKIVLCIPNSSQHRTHPTTRRDCTLEWVGATVIDGANKVHSSKNATDTVLTTLDPGMEEYLNPLVHLAIASQDGKILQAIRQGFRNVFGHAAAKGHHAENSFAKLPIGFDFAMKAVTEKLDAISNIDFKFNQPFIHIAMQPFLTELQQGRWSCMLCMAVRDCSRQLQFQTYSQPIQIPSPCIAISFNKTPQEMAQYGFNIDIEETVRLYQPYGIDQDWCSALTGIKLETIVTSAAQGLAAEYQRELENPSVTNVESFVVMP